MSERRVEAFFYGLYMDIDVLREAGVAPLAPRKAYVDGFALRIGQRATLLPSAGARAYGMLYTVTHTDLERLYTAPGLEQYRPEAVMARPLEARRRRPSATTCAKRRRLTNETPNTRPGSSGLSASSHSRRNTSRPYHEDNAAIHTA